MSVRQRTQQEIEDYIRTHSQKDGTLTRSMIDIANQIGYSNATIHRTLKALEEKGIIEITAAERPTLPNTIVYKGDVTELDTLLGEGVEISESLNELSNQVQEYMRKVERMVRKPETNTPWANHEVVNVVDVPDTDLQMITVRKPSTS